MHDAIMAASSLDRAKALQPSPRIDQSSTPSIRATHTEELVFALCGPIGSPLRQVATELSKILRETFDYDVKTIRLSSLIEDLEGKAPSTGPFARVRYLIEKGDSLRARFGPSVLADIAIREIAVERQERSPDGIFRQARVCHIIDSIKNESELEVLRLVYRDMLHCIGVFSPIDDRVQRLKSDGMSLPELHQLIDQDSGEELSYGQTIRDTFPKSDYFLRASPKDSHAIESRLLRYLHLLFSTQVVTPTPGETAMYQAASAARNSACLSRQVGASILDQEGQLLSIGWNDVPRFGGGLYVASPSAPGDDKRCANWGSKCYNDEEKKLIATETIEALTKAGLLSGSKTDAVTTILKSKVGRLLEFSRAIHAEMFAILTAGQVAGGRVKGAALYCTTYPCHYCARHLVAAGIAAVFYIEPYRKSLALKLHHDAISEDDVKGHMAILPYDGIAPNKFLELFGMSPNERKVDGSLKTRNPKQARPKSEVTLESLPALEALIVSRLKEHKLLNPEPGGAA